MVLSGLHTDKFLHAIQYSDLYKTHFLLLQDTVVALRALAKFAESTYTSEIEQSVIFSLPGLSSNVVRAVNKKNRFQRFDVEVWFTC